MSESGGPGSLPESLALAERSVIGTLLSYPQSATALADRLCADHFAVPAHRLAFEAIAERIAAGQSVDPVLLGNALERGIGNGMGWVSAFQDSALPPEDLEPRVEIVRESALKRQLRELGAATVRLSDSGEASAEEILAATEKQLKDIEGHKDAGAKTSVSYADILPSFYGKLKTIIAQDDAIIGMPTGIRTLDEMTLGLQKQELVVLAARPSMGKTALALNVIEHACLLGKRAMIFSMEMPAQGLLQRSISSIGKIDNQHLRKGRFSRPEVVRLREADQVLAQFDIEIDDKPGLTLQQLRSRAFRAHRKRPIDIVMIDYMQLMQGPRGLNRNEQISEISRGLKQLARDLDTPVLALSQLNRSLESRPDKRPIASDLRESGAVEQDADVILFIYRDEFYHPDSEEKGIAELIVNKQRMGPTGVVKTRFLAQFSRFENLRTSASMF